MTARDSMVVIESTDPTVGGAGWTTQVTYGSFLDVWQYRGFVLSGGGTPPGAGGGTGTLPDAWLKLYAKVPELLIGGTLTRDANGAVTSASVVWPDGTAGTYTADTVNADGTVDAYHITYEGVAVRTVSQSAMTRDASGAVTVRPALTVA